MRARRFKASCIVTAAWLLVAPGLATDALANQQTARIRGQLSAHTAHVAEPIQLEIVVTATAGCRVIFPSIDSKLGDFEVIEQSDRFDVPSPQDVSERIWTRELILESLRPGEVQVPALEVQVTGPNINQLLRTERLTVDVLSVLNAGEQPNAFRDIESVVDVPVPNSTSRLRWWTLGLLGSGALALAILGAFRRRSHLSPASWAKRELAKLDASAAMGSRDDNLLLSSLTRILREYLELQFDLAAQVQTTEELVGCIKREDLLSAADSERLSTLLATADQVKFAGLHLGQAELAAMILDAKRLIDNTAATSPKNRTETNTAEGR